MDAWFSYVLKLSELVFSMKLGAYEDACATLVLSAAGVREAVEAASAPAEPPATDLVPVAEPKASDDSVSTDAAAPPSAQESAESVEASDTAESGKDDLAAHQMSRDDVRNASSTDQGETPTSSSTSPTFAANRSSVSHEKEFDSTADAAPPKASPAEAVGALLDAMQLRKPMRGALSLGQALDDIQAEADLVFHELEDAYTLQPDDLPVATTTQSQPASPPPPYAGHLHEGSAFMCESAHSFPPAAVPSSKGLGSAVSSPTTAMCRQLLYGELTSFGVRQLQAISMAAVCVAREGLSQSRSSQHCAFGASPPSLSPGAGSFGGHAESFRNSYGGGGGGGNGPSLLLASGGVPRGAVVVAVDVGSGNGRLLFEWARLAAAACRRRPEASRRRTSAEDSTGPATAVTSGGASSVATPQLSTGNNSLRGNYAAVARRGNLLAATHAPRGVGAPTTVWRGWMGVGLELVPSRMRIARRALVPHYLNLRPALLVPASPHGSRTQREGPVSQLDPVAPEAITVAPSSSSYSNAASLHSTAALRTAPGSAAASPIGATSPLSLVERVPQPTARVLLYEGDALAPGVLSNSTLCRFPYFTLPGESLSLLRGGLSAGAAPSSTAPDLVNGLGGEQMGSIGAVGGGYHTSYLSAPQTGAGSGCFGHSAPSVIATAAALNNTYLNNAILGAHGRRAPASVLEMSMCSAASNASSFSSISIRGGAAAKENYYRLCRVEHGVSITGREDPHLVVFCCGLGFDETQVRRLCLRLEDMLLRRTTPSSPAPAPGSCDGRRTSALHGGSEDGSTFQQDDTDAASPSSHNPPSVYSEDNVEELEELERGFGLRPLTPTAADPTAYAKDLSSYRHWESVTCVLLLRPMDVLAPSFPLFRYATCVYDTQRQPVAAEDTALLLSSGTRADGSAARYVMRDLPFSESPQESIMTTAIQESEIWNTTLETTWMNAAPAWVVRFRF